MTKIFTTLMRSTKNHIKNFRDTPESKANHHMSVYLITIPV